MPLPTLRRVRTTDLAIRQVQDAEDLIFKDIARRQIVDGLLIKDVVITSGTPLSIDHGLGRTLQGWIVCKQNANSVIWETASSISSILILNASSTVTISLWVF